MNLFVVGDSFSADESTHSWVTLLSRHGELSNASQRGISEYRIFRTIKEHLEVINQKDVLIIFHTNPSRVYIPDGVAYPSRSLASHPNCDMVANDALASSSWQNIANMYYKNFYDDQLQQELFNFIIKEIRCMVKIKILDCSGFETAKEAQIKSFADIRKQFPGDINHLDIIGNEMVYNSIWKSIAS